VQTAIVQTCDSLGGGICSAVEKAFLKGGTIRGSPTPTSHMITLFINHEDRQ